MREGSSSSVGAGWELCGSCAGVAWGLQGTAWKLPAEAQGQRLAAWELHAALLLVQELCRSCLGQNRPVPQ